MKFIFDWKKYEDLARQVAADGCVLMKNDLKALPISDGEKVAIFGRTQFDYIKSGTGSGGMVNAPYVVNVYDGLKACDKIHVDEIIANVYKEWIVKNPFDKGVGWASEPWSQVEMPLGEELVRVAAKQNDVAVIVIGRLAGEDKDNSVTEGSYLLRADERNMLDIVCKCFTRTVVVLNTGNTIDMKWVDEYHPAAVLYAWQGGSEGGNAVADVLTGKVNPSGRLSDTIAYNIDDYPSTSNFGSVEKNIYKEDIYVGYRYFETFVPEKVMYPFGYGLSYTSFETKSSLTQENDYFLLSISVTNMGSCSGREVVCVYFGAPCERIGCPTKQLIRFVKTHELQPGEEQKLELKISISEMTAYDDAGYTGHKNCYVVEKGQYRVFIGANVREAVYCGSVNVAEDIVKGCKEALAPVEAFTRLNASKVDEMIVSKYQDVPTRSVSMIHQILADREQYKKQKTSLVYTGDQGFKLSDVEKGKCSMEQFLAQLTDEEMICLSRGEGMCSPKVTPGTAAAFGGVTTSLAEYGIPVACCADGPSGIRMDCGAMAFSLPGGMALACSFDCELVEKLYEYEGMELRKNQIDTLLGPGINIHRHPLNGRNFEYFSEDPYLTGKIAVSELNGMGKAGTTGTIKHYACNNQETGRHTADSVVSERALREIYLKPFEMAVREAHAYCIMSTYGVLNNVYTAGNYELLTRILRDEWGYDGIVMTDWWARISDDGKAGDRKYTSYMIRAQNDVYMVTADSLNNTNDDDSIEGLTKGTFTREDLYRNSANIMRTLMRMPAYKRLRGEEDQWVTLNEPEIPGGDISSYIEIHVSDDTKIDEKKLDTSKGAANMIFAHFAQLGQYVLSFEVSADCGELAQIPMSIYGNNVLKKVVSINGSQKEWLCQEMEVEVQITIDSYIKIVFGQEGMRLRNMRITRRGC